MKTLCGAVLAMAMFAARAGTFEEMVPMPDGTRLYTYGVRPAEGVKCPIVIQRNPYVDERRVDLAAYAKSQAGSLARGYAYLVQHCRGCGMSEGDWIPYENERSDSLALLEWARKLPWYNGELFLDGGSYLSSVHWSYLDTNPPDVKGAALSVQEVDRLLRHLHRGHLRAFAGRGREVVDLRPEAPTAGFPRLRRHQLRRNAQAAGAELPG